MYVLAMLGTLTEGVVPKRSRSCLALLVFLALCWSWGEAGLELRPEDMKSLYHEEYGSNSS